MRRDIAGSPARSPWSLLGVLAPYGVFAVLLVATWKRWILPFQDSPREVLTALRISEGEVLYRDVTYSYGPVAPYLDAAAFRLFGETLETLVVWRVLLSLLAVEGIRRLARRLLEPVPGGGREAGVAAIAGLVVAACFFQGQGGAYPFPYSVAALEGTVATWWALELALGAESRRRTLAAGLVAGLAAACKVEYLAAAAGPLLALFLWRPRREALAATAGALALPAAAYLIPIFLLPLEHLFVYGPLIALRVPETWKTLYREVFWGGSAREFLSGGFLRILWPSGALMAAAALGAWRAASAAPGVRRALAALFFAFGGLAAWSTPGASALHVLMPLGMTAFAIDAWGALRRGGLREPSSPAIARVAVGLSMLPALLRQPFFFLINVYAAFSAPLAMAVGLSFLLRKVRAARLFAAFLAGITGAQMVSRVEYFRAGPWMQVSFPRGSFVLRDWDARLLRGLVEIVGKTTPPGSYVAGFPDGGLVLFLTGRRSPFRDTQFHHGVQNDLAESRMIDDLKTKDVRAAFVVDLPTFLPGTGRPGEAYLKRFWVELNRRFVPVVRIGPYAPGKPWGPVNASALIYLPAPGGSSPRLPASAAKMPPEAKEASCAGPSS
ncbi:MAG: glycosyltransferase family 39 protein [Acidithiobacillales bacterium]